MIDPTSKTRPILTAAYAALALHLQEAATGLSHNDIRRRLDDALQSGYKAISGENYYYCYLVDIFGDDQSGDVVYSFRSELMRAPFTCSDTGASIEIAKAVKVVPITTYELESAPLTEAGRRNSARDMKQLQAIHDGAVGLGAMCKTKEAAAPVDGLKLSEASPFPVDLALQEAFTAGHKIKLIAPGKGSTAFYTEEVLKRDGPIVFKAGTPMRIDHPTAQQEAERPEGSVKDWGAVLSQDAVWMQEGPAGAGLYSEVKPFSDHALTIAEKGPYAGVSIAAWGDPVRENDKIVTREGVPLLARLTSADGVDMVTRAGCGGMFLTEAARSANPNDGGDPMDAAQITKLQEAVQAQAASNAKLLERALRGDAREEAVRILKGSTLIEAAKERVIDTVLRETIPQTEGVLDVAKFTLAVNEAAKVEGAYVAGLTGNGGVRGLGAPAPVVPINENDAANAKANREQRLKESIQSFRNMGMPEEAAKRAASRGIEEVA